MKQQVGDRRRGHGVHQLADQTQLRESHLRDRLASGLWTVVVHLGPNAVEVHDEVADHGRIVVDETGIDCGLGVGELTHCGQAREVGSCGELGGHLDPRARRESGHVGSGDQARGPAASLTARRSDPHDDRNGRGLDGRHQFVESAVADDGALAVELQDDRDDSGRVRFGDLGLDEVGHDRVDQPAHLDDGDHVDPGRVRIACQGRAGSEKAQSDDQREDGRRYPASWSRRMPTEGFCCSQSSFSLHLVSSSWPGRAGSAKPSWRRPWPERQQ